MDIKKRLKNKPFLVALFAAAMMLLQTILEPIGIDVTLFNETITNIFNAVLAVLIILGVVVDPLTGGISDKEK